MASVKTGTKQSHAGQFKPGVSGNPKGRPQGSRSKATLLAEGLMQEHLSSVVKRVLHAAVAEGDLTACKLVLDKMLPNCKDKPLDAGAIRLPTLTGSNLAEAQATVARALAGGRLTPSEAEALSKTLDAHRKAVELQELEQRLEALERANASK